MKNIFVLFLLSISMSVFSQKEKIEIYNPDANASEELETAIKNAKTENKHVLVQIGGNWCPWCIKLHQFIYNHHQIDSIISADYVFVRINYSKENRNLDVLERFEYPQRFGFPVMLVLDANGKRIHTQDTGYLEENKGYSEDKLKRFLLLWNRNAINSENYKY